MNTVGYRRALSLCRVILVMLVCLTFLNFWYVNKERDYDEHYLFHANLLRLTSQRVAKHAVEALRNNLVVFQKLKQNADDFEKDLTILKSGIKDKDKMTELPPSPLVV